MFVPDVQHHKAGRRIQRHPQVRPGQGHLGARSRLSRWCEDDTFQVQFRVKLHFDFKNADGGIGEADGFRFVTVGFDSHDGFRILSGVGPLVQVPHEGEKAVRAFSRKLNVVPRITPRCVPGS